MKKALLSKRSYFVALLSLFLILTVVAYQLLDQKSEVVDNDAHFSTSSSILNTNASIDYYEDRLRKEPNDLSSKLSLVQIYLQHARQTRQEPIFLPKAEALLASVLSDAPESYQARALQASLYNTLHQFELARDLALELIAENDRLDYIYGILVDALVELGEYEKAIEACDRMIELRPGIASYARAAYLRELHGEGESAMEAMKLAADAGLAGHENRSWALYQVGQLYLGQNNVEAARHVFEGIMDEHYNYPFALGGLGQVALLNGDEEEAIALFDQAYAIMQDDRFLEGKLEAYTVLGDEKAISEIEVLLEESYMSAAQMGENVRMEYADFLADIDQNLDEAFKLASLEYERRPDHLHALETYAWTLHKTDRSAEAIPFIERAMRLNTGDAMVHYRAAQIYDAADHDEEAIHHLEYALENHLHVESISAAREADARLQDLRM